MANSYASRNEYHSILSSVDSKNDQPNTCRCLTESNSSTSSTDFDFPQAKITKNIEFDKFKKILQKASSNTGYNVYDHLVDIIRRITDERPPNVSDYFEQFSRDVRKNKLPSLNEEPPQFLELARSVIEFVKPSDLKENISYIDEFEGFVESEMTIYQSIDSLDSMKIERPLLENENILRTQHYFAFCGLGFHIDEVFQLSLSVQKVQLHQNVQNARFWGRIFGLKGSYYIVEAVLTKSATKKRQKEMKQGLFDKMKSFITGRNVTRTSYESDVQLMPGSNWQNSPEEDLKKMHPPIEPIPKLSFDEVFNEPEEPVGTGLNRMTYFCTTSLSEKWEELPNVAPKHIRASKNIKKYFTGNLKTDLQPQFPGNEEHYLRAMVARITAGTFIAPKGYYRIVSRKERKLTEMSQETEEGEVESEDEDDNGDDVPIIKNSDYKTLSLEDLEFSRNWVHVTPNILDQGRIKYLNVQWFIDDLEKRVRESMYGACEKLADEIEQELPVDKNFKEISTELLQPCSLDKNRENVPSWTSRRASVYNDINKMVLMRSNLWPGAYSIVYENFSDCIYLGWGSKYVARCFSLEEPTVINDDDCADLAQEITDPTVKMEEIWRRYHLKKSIAYDFDEMSDVSVEVDFDDEI